MAEYPKYQSRAERRTEREIEADIEAEDRRERVFSSVRLLAFF